MNRIWGKKAWAGLFLVLCGVFQPVPAEAYQILYAEQWFQLFHRHLYEDPDRAMENIYYLEQAQRADFANPLNALARVENPRQWELYRYLFYTQTSLLLIEQYLILARNFDKRTAYWYNYPWKSANLDSLNTAEQVYEFARVYWNQARDWSAKAARIRWIHLPEIQFWADQSHRIETGDLNYGAIIDRQLARLRRVRRDFEAMGPQTY